MEHPHRRGDKGAPAAPPFRRCSMVQLVFLKWPCHPSHFGTIRLLSSHTPADFRWSHHTRCCISESGWFCTRQGEAPPQRRNVPAKFFYNNTLLITHLFAILCRESRKTVKCRHQKPGKVYLTHLF